MTFLTPLDEEADTGDSSLSIGFRLAILFQVRVPHGSSPRKVGIDANRTLPKVGAEATFLSCCGGVWSSKREHLG